MGGTAVGRYGGSLRATALGALWVLLAAPAAAQEISVAIDSAGRIERIDRTLERRLNLFPEVPGFLEARLFRAADDRYVLEITHRVGGRLARTRRILSPAEAAAFRAEVLAAMTSRARTALLDQSGRGELIRGSFLLALGYYGWAVPVTFDTDDERTAVGLYTLTAGVSFFAPLFATSRARVTLGQSSLANWGGTRGIAYGMMTAQLLQESPDPEFTVGLGMAGSLVGWTAGFFGAGAADHDQGTADAMGMLGDIGTGVGLATAYLLGGFDRDTITFERRRAGWAGGLLGAGAGLAAGRLLAAGEHTTRGDVGVFRAAALLGSWAGFTTAFVLDEDPYNQEFDKAEAAGLLAGTAVGLVGARLLTRNRDFTSSQGMLVSIGTLGGGLLASGLAYLATDEDSDNDLVFVAGAIGSAAGFGLVYRAFADEARAEAMAERLSLSVNPFALAARSSARPAPVVSLGFRF